MNLPFRSDDSSLWSDPRLATLVATIAISLLIVTIWLMRRRSKNGRGAAVVCLVISFVLHAVLIYFLPSLTRWGEHKGNAQSPAVTTEFSEVLFGDFQPTNSIDPTSVQPDVTDLAASLDVPLPLSAMNASSQTTDLPSDTPVAVESRSASEAVDSASDASPVPDVPATLASADELKDVANQPTDMLDDLLSEWLSQDAERAGKTASETIESPITAPTVAPSTSAMNVTSTTQTPESSGDSSEQGAAASSGSRAAALQDRSDFANRSGDAKRQALLTTGGDESTEAAVEAALKFLAADQQATGAWDPITSGAGRETMTLGTDRGGAGKQATNGLTGLALLAMLGAGNTHQDGPYAENVYRGLAYLIRSQKPDGSLAGPATVYESNYCHGMAALAMCEAAAMTGDESAIISASAAVRYTINMQHPITGGWRYVKGDPGDLSQLGWQAMVLEAGRRASVNVPPHCMTATSRFLRSVRSGQNGGLASYRPGEAPTRTMTAEALATRLLLGETIPPNEISEAESFLLRQPPGVGKDNYYGWYYTALALHQLQDDAWHRWNDAMKQRLTSRQLSNGSWPTDDEWGGYGGRVYTTAMAALCLEVYYRHAIRATRVTQGPPISPVR